MLSGLTILAAKRTLDAHPVLKWSIIAVPIIVVLLIGGWIFNACERRTQNKIDKYERQATTGKVEANVISNQIDNAKEELKDAQTNSNLAADNYNAQLRRDSGEWADTDERITTDRFCRRYPNDSTCDEWRRVRGMQPAASKSPE